MSLKLPIERAMDTLSAVRDMRVRFRNGEDVSEEAISELRMNVVEKADPFANDIDLSQVLEMLIDELEEFEIEVFNSKSEAKEVSFTEAVKRKLAEPPQVKTGAKAKVFFTDENGEKTEIAMAENMTYEIIRG